MRLRRRFSVSLILLAGLLIVLPVARAAITEGQTTAPPPVVSFAAVLGPNSAFARALNINALPANVLPARADGQVIELELEDIAFDLKALTIQADTPVTIRLTNEGAATHSFNIDKLNVHSGDLRSGESASVRFTAPAGVYTYYCNIPGHKEAGMVGTLTVVAKAPATPVRQATPVAGAMTLRIELRDISFDPEEMTVPERTLIILIVINTGAAFHDFNIDDLDVHSGDVASGGTVTLIFDSGSPGVHTYFCSIPGHKEAGMVGKLTVTKSNDVVARSGSPRASPVAQASPTARATVPPRATVRAIPRKTATVADGCAGFDEYQRAMKALQFKMLFEPGMVTLLTLDEGVGLFDLTPEQYKSIADVFGVMADGMAEIEPPIYASAWHEDVRAEFDLLRDFFDALAAGSIPVSIFRDVSNGDQLDAKIAADAAAAARVCPAFAAFADEWGLGSGI